MRMKGAMIVITTKIGLVDGEFRPLEDRGSGNLHQSSDPAEGFSPLTPRFLNWCVQCSPGHRDPSSYMYLIVLAGLRSEIVKASPKPVRRVVMTPTESMHVADSGMATPGFYASSQK
jgi:hypothetical protein